MNHAITVGDLLHYTLFASFLASFLIVGCVWLYAFAAGMSDAPGRGPSATALYGVLLLPVVLFAAWWFT